MENIEIVATNTTWFDILDQNKDAQKKIKEYDQALIDELIGENNIHAIVDRETISSINSELAENIKEAQKRILYEFQSYSESDIKHSKLTQREVEILRLRMIHNRCVDVAEIMELDVRSVNKSFLAGIKKIKKYRKYKAKNQDEFNCLSDQQQLIYDLVKKGLPDKEVANHLNIGITTVSKQRKRISEKMNKELSPVKRKELSVQQQRIYELLSLGYKNKEIAEKLSVNVSVVNTQKSRIKKLGYFEKTKQK